MKVESKVCAATRLLGIIGLVAVLSGCAVAMLGGAARSGSSSGSSGGSAAVRSRFSAHPTLKPLKLTVDTHDGVVTLRGQVNSVEQRNAAQLEARAVRGVKAVKNELVVR
jgi:hypothetical protein